MRLWLCPRHIDRVDANTPSHRYVDRVLRSSRLRGLITLRFLQVLLDVFRPAFGLARTRRHLIDLACSGYPALAHASKPAMERSHVGPSRVEEHLRRLGARTFVGFGAVRDHELITWEIGRVTLAFMGRETDGSQQLGL
jgi:hypothetical protein